MPAVQETIEQVRHIDVDQYKHGFVTDSWWLESAIAQRYSWAGFGLTRPIKSAFNSSQASPSPRGRYSAVGEFAANA